MQLNVFFLIVLTTATVAEQSSDLVMRAVVLSESAKNGAVCLDGTPPVYYIRTGAEPSKFYIHQEGGGWCSSDKNCLHRSRGRYGSSKNYSDTLSLNHGYFSDNPEFNVRHSDGCAALPHYDARHIYCPAAHDVQLDKSLPPLL